MRAVLSEEDLIDNMKLSITKRQWQETASWMEEGISRKMNNGNFFYLCAITLVYYKEYQKALEHLDFAIASPGFRYSYYQVNKFKLFCYIQLKNFKEARKVGANLAPDMKELKDIQVLNMMAYLDFIEKNYSDAIAKYKQVLSIEEDDITALNGLAFCYIDGIDMIEEGLQLAIRALNLNPIDPLILDTVAWGYYKKGDLQKALGYIQDALNKKQEPVIEEHFHIIQKELYYDATK